MSAMKSNLVFNPLCKLNSAVHGSTLKVNDDHKCVKKEVISERFDNSREISLFSHVNYTNFIVVHDSNQ